ncbi:MAG TPA: ABC transporter ATP-binding protein [Nocardioidaceae bacterium]|nr:ABC transporter ATP-binding protein [Nocardioidaceae bacterium]
MTQHAIHAVGLTKDYGGRRGLDRLDMTVEQGEVFGFLGPNGAGKSTTIRLILDLLRPTAGTIRVFGVDPASGPGLRSRIGYLPGELALDGRHQVGELLGFFARLRGGVPAARVADLADRLGLDLSRQVRSLSKGNKQKVGIVAAFMHEPDLLVLDEPTSGLDPIVQQTFLAMVREARDAGRTVFMSSHVLNEVEETADRVAIVRDGRLVMVSDLSSLQRVRRFEVTFAHPVTATELGAPRGVADLQLSGSRLQGTVDGEVDDLVKALARHTVVSLRVEDPNLEELFLRQYQAPGPAPRTNQELQHVR